MAARPQDSFLQATESWGEAKGAYRLIGNDAVTLEALQAAGRNAAVEACRGRAVVLAVSDTTALNFTTHRATAGLGPIGEQRYRGLLMHSTLALTSDGVPLGVLRQEMWARKDEEYGSRHARKQREFEDKESYRWLASFQEGSAALDALSENERPDVLHVFDREGDIHEVLENAAASSDGYIIRSSRNRRVKGEDQEAAFLREAVAQAPILGTELIDVPRKQGERKRKATVRYQACELTVDPPSQPKRNRQPFDLNVVWVTEVDPPAGIDPLDWLLLTSEPIDNLRDVRQIVEFYRLRWRIEEYHLILKSGCRMESVQFESAERIYKVLSLYGGVALRILQLNYRARTEPDLPCTTVLSDVEWRALQTHIKGKPPEEDQPPPTLRQAVLWVGRLGGHAGRKGDGMPGVRSLWRGWRDLALLAVIYAACQGDGFEEE